MTAALQVFMLPDLGEGLTEAELVNWLVAVGDEIRVDQPIAEVETAKSMVEVPSPYAGTVVSLHGEAGQTLEVGKPLISVAPVPVVELVETQEKAGSTNDHPVAVSLPTRPLTSQARSGNPAVVAPGSTNDHPVAVSTGSTNDHPVVEPVETQEKAGSGNVLIGYGTPGGSGQARRTRAPRHPVPPVVEVSTGSTTEMPFRTRVPGKLGAVISPLVRRMAREHGVDLGEVHGSGDSGLIMRRDVEAVITPGSRQARSPEQSTTVDARTGLGISARTPLRGVRKAVAANMSRSRSEIPEATVWVDVDATALVELRASLKKADQHSTPGLLAFIARFVTAGLKKYPALNTRFVTTEDAAGGESQEIVAFAGINLGFAAQTDRGLMVPSIRNADKLSARELDAEIRRLTAVVRDGKATPEQLGSGTFTLNNYGVFGVDGSAAIINHPEVAILGVGRILDKPWVVDGELAVRKVTELTLTFDHRVCDGGTAAGFLRFVADCMENPGAVLADL